MSAEATKRCPYCGEQILAVAIKCKHCGSQLDGSPIRQEVVIKGADPFAEYHTPIQGKKSGRLTPIGIIGVAFGGGLMFLALLLLNSSYATVEGVVLLLGMG